MNEFVEAIERLGFRVAVEPVHKLKANVRRGGHQVGVFRISTAGGFVWGWVETPTGRTDLRSWSEWFRALQMVVA